MTYEYECVRCERRIAHICKSIKEKPDYLKCPNCGSKARRIVSKFLFVANMAKDDPDNNEARIVTRSASSLDQLEYLRKVEKTREEILSANSEDPTDFSFDGIDINGAWTAAHAGPEQLERWRKDNIKADDLPVDTNA